MVVVRIVLVEALAILTAQMQEEHDHGKNILCPVIPTQRVLTKRGPHIKKLNLHFCLVLHFCTVYFPHIVGQGDIYTCSQLIFLMGFF